MHTNDSLGGMLVFETGVFRVQNPATRVGVLSLLGGLRVSTANWRNWVLSKKYSLGSC